MNLQCVLYRMLTKQRRTIQIQTPDNKHITYYPISSRQIGALGSGPRRITKRKAKRRQQKDKSYKINILWDFFYRPLATLTAKKRALTDKN